MNYTKKGVAYFCGRVDCGKFSSAWQHPDLVRWERALDEWYPSPSESFSLYSFWLGRDSDELLDLTSKPTTTPDFTFAYLEQD